MNQLLPYEIPHEEQHNVEQLAHEILRCYNPMQMAVKSKQLEFSMRYKNNLLSVALYQALVQHYVKSIFKLVEMSESYWEIARQLVASLNEVIIVHHHFKLERIICVDLKPFSDLITQLQYSHKDRIGSWALMTQLLKLMLYLRPHAKHQPLDLSLMQHVQPIQLEPLIHAHSLQFSVLSTFNMPQDKEFVQQVKGWLKLVNSFVSLKCLDVNMVDYLSRLLQDSYPVHRDLIDSDLQKIIFDCVMRWFELPIGSGLGSNWNVGSTQVLSHHSYTNQTIKQFEGLNQAYVKSRRDKLKSAALIVLYGVEDLQLVSNWFSAIETFLHPSNHGRWSGSIVKFLKYLTQELHHRVMMEQCSQVSYGKEFYLSLERRDEIVKIVLPLIEMALYTKDAFIGRDAFAAIRHLSWIQPKIVSGLIGRLLPSLNGGLEISNRIGSSLRALSSISMALIHRLHSPHSIVHLGAIMSATLPRIDMNDSGKCFSAMLLLCKVFAVLPVHEIRMGFDAKFVPSQVNDKYSGPTMLGTDMANVDVQKETMEACRILQSQLPDFLYELLAKLSTLIENMPHLTMGAQSAEVNMMSLAVLLMEVIIRQSSISNLVIIENWLYKICDMRIYPVTKYVADILSIFLSAKPDAIQDFLSRLQRCVEQEIQYGAGLDESHVKLSFESEDSSHGRHKDSALWHYLVLYRACASCVGRLSGEQQPRAVDQVRRFVSENLGLLGSRTCYSVMSRIIRVMITSMGSSYVIEQGTLPSNASDERVSIESFLWGVSPYERVCSQLALPLGSFIRGYRGQQDPEHLHEYSQQQLDEFWSTLRQELDLKWHVASDDERTIIVDLVKQFAEPEVKFLTLLVAKKGQQSAGVISSKIVDKICKSLTMLYHMLQSMAGLLASDPASIKIRSTSTRDRFSSSSSYASEYDNCSVADAFDQMEDDDEDEDAQVDDDDDQDDEEVQISDMGSGGKNPIETGYAFSDLMSPQYQYLLNLRRNIEIVLLELGNYIQTNHEDEIYLFDMYIKVLRSFMCDRGIEKHRFDDQTRIYQFCKSIIRLGANRELKMYPKYLMQKRIGLMHLKRLKHNGQAQFGNLIDQSTFSRLILDSLLNLSTCQYDSIQNEAQEVLQATLRSFPSVKNQLLDRVFVKLQASIDELDSLYGQSGVTSRYTSLIKCIIGCLHILNIKQLANVCKRQWKYVNKYMLAICRIVQVDDQKVHKTVGGMIAQSFVTKFAAQPFYVQSTLSDEETPSKFKVAQAKKFEENVAVYNELLSSLMTIIQQASHGKIKTLALSLVGTLHREDVPLREDVTRMILKCLVDDMLIVRQTAFLQFSFIAEGLKNRSLLQYKQENGSQTFKDIASGEKWLQLHHQCVNKSLGWLLQPQSFKFYDENGVDCFVFRSDTQSQAAVSALYSQFSSQKFWEQLLHYISQEPSLNGADRRQSPNVTDEEFSQDHVQFFRRVFQNFGDQFLYDVVLPIVKPWFEKFDDRHVQRACAEFLCGLIRGMKHWPPKQSQRAWQQFIVANLKLALLSCTPDSINYWSKCLRLACKSRSVAMMNPLIDLVFDDRAFQVDLNSESAFGEQKKLSFVRDVLSEFRWKLKDRVVVKFPQFVQLIDHRYKAVRDMTAAAIAEFCVSCYKPDSLEFFAEVDVTNQALVNQVIKPDQCIERCFNQAVQLMRKYKAQNGSNLVYGTSYSNTAKFLMQWLAEAWQNGRTYLVLPMVLYESNSLLLDLFAMQTTDDQDLSKKAIQILNFFPDVTFASTCASLYIKHFVALVAKEIALTREIASAAEEEASRRIKLRSLAMLQIFFFRHMFYLLGTSADDYGKDVDGLVNIVLRLLCDSHVEVRLLSSITLSGLVRCFGDAFDKKMVEKLLKSCLQLLSARLDSDDGVTKRHAGVLGVSALVAAYPYEIPVWLPDILVTLSRHVKNPSPIDSTVKKVFADFRRTHQDNWHEDVLNGDQDQYREIYGYGSSQRFSKATDEDGGFQVKKKGMFTARHLEALEGFLTSSASYYA